MSERDADARIVRVLRDEQRSRAGFPRVHAVPDNLTDIEDRRATALVILPPSAYHDPGAGAESPAVAAAREALERRGSGQRNYRNALIFAAPDASNIDAARQNARRERAWQSILNDADLRDNLTRAQTSDAKGQAERSREALVRSIRQSWVHVLHPGPPDAGDNPADTQRGYVVRATRLINRGGAKGIPKVVWDKISGDGTVIAEMGPQNLARSLAPVWPADRPHVPVETIRDWFASYAYMPRLRDDATLNRGLERLIKDLAEPYVFAAAFEEDTGTYDGAIEGIVRVTDGPGSGLLVRREAVPRTVREPGPGEYGADEVKETERDETEPDEPVKERTEAPPTRFFASIPVEPDRAGLVVARIMDALLVELTRSPGSNVRVTLDLEGYAEESGYPKDVVDIVKANARDLKIDKQTFGFER